MARPVSSVFDRDAKHILQLTCLTPQQEELSTGQTAAPSPDVRKIRTTQSPPQWYISYACKDHVDEPESASDNAYFASDAVEYKHVLVTLNDKGGLCIQDESCFGGVSINGKVLQKQTPTILPPSGWTYGLTLKLTVYLASSALTSIENSSTPRVKRQLPLKKCADIDVRWSPDTAPTTPCGRKNQSNSTQEETPTPQAARKRPHSHTEPGDDHALPIRRDTSPRPSDPDIHHWQESLPSGRWPDVRSTCSQQDYDTGASPARMPDYSLTRSRSNSTVSSDGDEPSTPPELRNQYPGDLLSDQVREELLMFMFTKLLHKGYVSPGFRVMLYPYIKVINRIQRGFM